MQGMFDDFWKVLGAIAAVVVAAALGVGFLLGRL